MDTFDAVYEEFINKHSEMSKKGKTITELSSQVCTLRGDCDKLKKQLTNLQLNSDERLARDMQDTAIGCPQGSIIPSHALAEQIKQIKIELDKQEQYGRREILNFLEIPLEGTRNHPENTTIMIINFLRRHFNLHITYRDISVSHRTIIPSDL